MRGKQRVYQEVLSDNPCSGGCTKDVRNVEVGGSSPLTSTQKSSLNFAFGFTEVRGSDFPRSLNHEAVLTATMWRIARRAFAGAGRVR